MANQTAVKSTNKPAAKSTAPTTAVASAPEKAEKPKVNLDFGSLTVEAADAPLRASSGRKATWQPHPVLVSALDASWDGRKVLREYTVGDQKKFTYIGSGKQIVVNTEDEAKALVTAIRKVAAHKDMGVATSIEQQGNRFAVRFAAKTRKQKGTRTS